MGMVSEMEDKVYFTHSAYIGKAADFFVRGKSPEEIKSILQIADYFLSDCDYVVEFLKKNPEYSYVGSTDNMHSYGWGMDFEGYAAVGCPKLEE